jgi:hypothetical protein
VQLNPLDLDELDPTISAFYREAITTLQQAGLPFLVGGAYALQHYTGVTRHTKDFDVFVLPKDCPAVLRVFGAKGYATDLTFPHWLGKVYSPEAFLDVIFSSGNGLVEVDAAWFDHAPLGMVMGYPVRLAPPEEIIWSKSFIMEREHFDGADVAHLLHACGPDLDWDRLLGRFGPHWRVLLSHLVLFSYIYPGKRSVLPERVLDLLLSRLREEHQIPAPDDQVCQGTLLSREQYLLDLERDGYRDARLAPQGKMTRAAVAHWTRAISQED